MTLDPCRASVPLLVAVSSRRRRISRVLPWIASVLMLMVLLWSGDALAKKIFMGKFTGPGGARIRPEVAKKLARKHRIVNRQGAADAVVTGTVRKKGRRYSVKITVRDRRSGKVLGAETYTLRGPRMDNATATKAAEDLSGYVDEAGGKGGGAPEPKEGPPPTAEAEPVIEKKPKVVAEPPPPPPPATPPPPPERVVARARPAWMSPVEIGLLLPLMVRSFEMTNAGAAVKPNYENATPVGGLGLEASIYPLLFFNRRSFADGFGVRFTYAQTLLLKSSLLSAPDQKFDSVYRELSFALVYRIFFLKRATSPVLIPRIGLSRVSFAIDYPAAIVGDPAHAQDLLPNVTYTKFLVGMDGWIPFATTYIGLFLTFEARLGGGAGDLTVAAGAGSALGFEIGAGLAGRIYKGLGYRATFDYASYSISFGAPVTISTQTVDKATDTYKSGRIMLTYDF